MSKTTQSTGGFPTEFRLASEEGGVARAGRGSRDKE